MYGYIYAVTNTINGKIYIGQTTMTISQRWNKHISKARQKNTTGLSAAIGKYGTENFEIEVLCEAPLLELDALEIYYIEKYDSFYNGYNLTLGGKGGTILRFDEEEVVQKYKELKTIQKTASHYKCGVVTISNILHKNGVKINRNPYGTGGGRPFKEGEGIKSVRIVETGQIFPSLKECSQWLIDNGHSRASTMELARKSLSRCLTGERKTYCKFHFEYA